MAIKISNAKDFGMAIRQRRKELGYTQGFLSEFSGLSASFISNLENFDFIYYNIPYSYCSVILEYHIDYTVFYHMRQLLEIRLPNEGYQDGSSLLFVAEQIFSFIFP